MRLVAISRAARAPRASLRAETGVKPDAQGAGVGRVGETETRVGGGRRRSKAPMGAGCQVPGTGPTLGGDGFAHGTDPGEYQGSGLVYPMKVVE